MNVFRPDLPSDIGELTQYAFDIQAEVREQAIGRKVVWDEGEDERYGEIIAVNLDTEKGLLFSAMPYLSDETLSPNMFEMVVGDCGFFGWEQMQ